MAQNAFQTFLGAAQSLPGFGKNKPYAQIHTTEQSTPLCNPPYYGGGPPPAMHHGASKPSPKHEVLTSRFHSIRRYTKIAVVCSNVFSGIFSSIMESCMIFVTYKFYKTKDLDTPDRPWGPWPKETKLWPTYMLAASSGVTTILALCLLIALCCQAKRKAAFFSILYSVIHVVFWVGISVTYRIAKKKDDLWGWSCSDQAKEIQKQLGSGLLDFERLCTIQVSSSHETIFYNIGENPPLGFQVLTYTLPREGPGMFRSRKSASRSSLLECLGTSSASRLA